MAAENSTVSWTGLTRENHISHYLDKTLLKSLVGSTCVLSICGSLLIILTYACFKEMRSTGRFILVHLSSMDLLTSITTLTGTLIAFHHYIYDQPDDSAKHWFVGCQVQAGIFLFATVSSVLWTDALALYIVIYLVSRRPKVAKACTYVMCVICYGVPLVVCVVLGVEGNFGLDNSTAGWCAIRRPHGDGDGAFAYSFFIGYDFWVMASFVLLPILYLIMKGYMLRMKYCTRQGESASLLSTADSTSYDRLKVVEWKLMLVPVFFIVLRVWTLALTIKFVYLQPSSSETISTSDYWLFYVAAVADSGQGFINGVLWCGLSLAVWQRCFRAVKRCPARGRLCCQMTCNGPCCRHVRRSHRPTKTAVLVPSPATSPLDSFVSNDEGGGDNAVERLRY